MGALARLPAVSSHPLFLSLSFFSSLWKPKEEISHTNQATNTRHPSKPVQKRLPSCLPLLAARSALSSLPRFPLLCLWFPTAVPLFPLSLPRPPFLSPITRRSFFACQYVLSLFLSSSPCFLPIDIPSLYTGFFSTSLHFFVFLFYCYHPCFTHSDNPLPLSRWPCPRENRP